MLQQRIITALALLAVLLPALFADSPTPFLAVSIVLIAAGAWEWGRLNGLPIRKAVLSAFACAGVCALAVAAGWTESTAPVVWLLAGAAWVGVTAWMLLRGVAGWAQWPRTARWLVGLGLIWLAWLAMAQARTTGVAFLLSILCLVWAADVMAYFFGRALGGRWFPAKLAPSISPGKSWEGVVGGMVGVFVLSYTWLALEQHYQWPVASLFTRLSAQGTGMLILSLVFMTTMSVVGDLVESLVKRSAGVKDSSKLLPGHGGVLDRLDALWPSLPIAMMLVSLIKPSSL